MKKGKHESASGGWQSWGKGRKAGVIALSCAAALALLIGGWWTLFVRAPDVSGNDRPGVTNNDPNKKPGDTEQDEDDGSLVSGRKDDYYTFLLIGRDFGVKTVYTSVVIPVFLAIFERVFPDQPSIMGDVFVDMVCYLFVVSVGQAILFTHNASSGGLDIVGKLLNKFFRIELGKAVALAGMCVAVCSVFINPDVKTVALSVLGTYLDGIVLDHFIFGFDQKRRVCIMSSKLEELRQFILKDLHSGATIYDAIGAYDMKPRRELVVIVDKHEYTALMDHVEKVDPKAFVTVYAVGSVSYQPKPGRR